jgi:hypothetical protein
MKFQLVRCKSGITGIRYRLQDSYSSFEQFEDYCEIYNLHTRLGYKTPKSAYRNNPMIESSVNLSDFRRVRVRK